MTTLDHTKKIDDVLDAMCYYHISLKELAHRAKLKGLLNSNELENIIKDTKENK